MVSKEEAVNRREAVDKEEAGNRLVIGGIDGPSMRI